ncbi:hypothetical protein ACFQS4_01555 [Saliphagus sp. GCM10025317]
MEINRAELHYQNTADKRVKDCLDRFEDASTFCEGISSDTEIVHSLPIEEVLEALVAAEMDLNGGLIYGPRDPEACGNCGEVVSQDEMYFMPDGSIVACTYCVDQIE